MEFVPSSRPRKETQFQKRLLNNLLTSQITEELLVMFDQFVWSSLDLFDKTNAPFVKAKYLYFKGNYMLWPTKNAMQNL